MDPGLYLYIWLESGDRAFSLSIKCKSFSFLFTSQLAGRHPIKTLIKTFIHPQTKYNPKDKIMLFNRLCSNKEYLQNVPIISILMTLFFYIPHQCGSGGVVLKKLLLDGCLWFVFKLLVAFPQPCTWTNITFAFDISSWQM